MTDSETVPTSRPSLQVPFGQSNVDGLLYEPREVPLGKACNCVCSGCGQSLYAKHCLDSNVTPHFAHAPGVDCQTGYMTAVHRAAQQLIEQERQLFLPYLPAKLSIRDAMGQLHEVSELLVQEGVQQFVRVTLEQSLGAIRPDISAESADLGCILIEIAVTCFVDEAKLDKARALGLPLLEIDFSELRDVNFVVLRDILFTTSSLKTWLFHPLLQPAENALRAMLQPTFEAAKKAAATLKVESDRQRVEAERCRQKEEQQLDVDEQEAERRWQNEKQQRDIDKQKADRAIKLQKHEKLKRAAVFKQKTEQDKSLILMAWTKTDDILELTGTQVRGGKSFGVADERIWQATLFSGLIHHQLSKGHAWVKKEFAIEWLGYRFDVTPKFNDSEKIAVWDYLVYLANCGALVKKREGYFRIAVSSIDSFRVLQAWLSGSVTTENLIWTDEVDWPDSATSHAIAVALSESEYLSSSWERLATLLPAARVQPPVEICQIYSTTWRLNPTLILRYLICSDFLRIGYL